MAAPVPVTGTGNESSAGALASATVVLSKPANLADGDVLLAYVGSRLNATNTITPPAGWSIVPNTADVTNDSNAVYFLAVPSAAAVTATSWTWTWPSSSRVAGYLHRVTGANLSAPIDAPAVIAASQTGTTQVALPAAAPSASSGLLVAFAFAVDQTATNNPTYSTAPDLSVGPWAAPSGMTKIAQVRSQSDTANGKVHLAVFTQTLAASGTTGTRTAAITSGPTTATVTNTSGALFVIAPSAALIDYLPTGDVTTTGWTSTGSSFYAVLADSDDATYAETGVSPVNALLETSYAPLPVPPDLTTVSFRRKLAFVGATSGTAVVSLYQGTTLVKATSSTALTGTPTFYGVTLTSTEASGLTVTSGSWANLHLRCVVSAS